MIEIVPRTQKSNLISATIPIMAVILTMVFGGILFWTLGKNPFETIRMIFWDLRSPQYDFCTLSSFALLDLARNWK